MTVNEKMGENKDGLQMGLPPGEGRIDSVAMANFERLVSQWERRKLEEYSPDDTDILRNGLAIHYNRLSLYRGGCESGLMSFGSSEDTTAGAGLYATSMVDQAFGYAVVRADNEGYQRAIDLDGFIEEPDMRPVVYEIGLEDVTFADLRVYDNIVELLSGLPDYMTTWFQRAVAQGREFGNTSDAHFIEILNRQAEEIKSMLADGKFHYLKNLVGVPSFIVGECFRDYLIGLGYDGHIALEGGERMNPGIEREHKFTGDHDSYVIFEPTKAIVKNEVSFDSPVVMSKVRHIEQKISAFANVAIPDPKTGY